MWQIELHSLSVRSLSGRNRHEKKTETNQFYSPRSFIDSFVAAVVVRVPVRFRRDSHVRFVTFQADFTVQHCALRRVILSQTKDDTHTHTSRYTHSVDGSIVSLWPELLNRETHTHTRDAPSVNDSLN